MNLPWKSSLKKIFEPFPTKLAGTLMMIVAFGAVFVAKATASKESTKTIVRVDRVVPLWGGAWEWPEFWEAWWLIRLPASRKQFLEFFWQNCPGIQNRIGGTITK